ncbi:MAG TPA: hypothetical protein VGE08_07985 [Steroidobacter sp.]|uniref:hypothetical protein n=1 Tax=Steroidobacter sp. TaxID=1978227 RepID=UPI002ED7FA75
MATIIDTALVENSSEARTEFNLVHLCWYAGTALVLIAFGLFASEIRDRSELGFAVCLSAYSIAAMVCAITVNVKLKRRTVLAGVLVASGSVTLGYAVLMFQKVGGWWDYGQFVPLLSDRFEYSLLTLTDRFLYSPLLAVCVVIVASLIGIWRFKFLPLCVLTTLGCWYIVLDFLRPDQREALGFTIILIGSATVAVAWFADNRKESANYGYWLTKMGMWILPIGLTIFFDEYPLEMFLFALANVGVMLVALYLRRPAGLLGGAAGVFYYLNYLYTEHFSDSLVFPFVVIALGVFVVWLGWWIHVTRVPLESLLPGLLQRWRPKGRTDPFDYAA